MGEPLLFTVRLGKIEALPVCTVAFTGFGVTTT
jgi:hypothetical protein